MTSRVEEVFAGEVSAGLRQLVGTRLLAAVEVSETVLQDALHRMRHLPQSLTVRVAPANRIVLRYGALHATAQLLESVDLRGPRIELELQSGVIAWALQRAITTPAVTVTGRRLTIDLSRVEGLACLSSLWVHLRSVRFATDDGVLFVHIDAAVD